MPCDFHRTGPPGTHTPWRAGILSIGSLSARVLIFLIVLRVHAGPDQLRGIRQGDDVHEAGHLSSCLPFNSGACVVSVVCLLAGGRAGVNQRAQLQRICVLWTSSACLLVLWCGGRCECLVCPRVAPIASVGIAGGIATIFPSCRRRAQGCVPVVCAVSLLWLPTTYDGVGL